jgi:CubicO group peptidase (beta-lactamase class C family)
MTPSHAFMDRLYLKEEVMKKLKILTLIFSISFFACTGSTDQKIDAILSAYQGDVPGASLIVIKNGQPLLKRNYGLANLAKKTPITSATNFRLASITKQFTAMCIMMLIEQGKLKYDTSLQEVFPAFPDYGKHITIKQLLQHSSGLVAYEDVLPDSVTRQVLDTDVLQMMKAQDSTYFEPGFKHRYSNSGYAVLAMIIEKLSGRSFATFLADNIFMPLKMDATVAFQDGISEVENRAFGYAATDSGFIFKDQSRTSAVLGDGGIYSSINDLYKWDQALYTGKLVSKSTLQKAWTPQKLEGTPDNIYGFGWRIDSLDGHRRLHHNGATSGFRNSIQRFPDDSLTVILLTNRSGPSVFPLLENIAQLLLR